MNVREGREGERRTRWGPDGVGKRWKKGADEPVLQQDIKEGVHEAGWQPKSQKGKMRRVAGKLCVRRDERCRAVKIDQRCCAQ
jgi:hypothetical protein